MLNELTDNQLEYTLRFLESATGIKFEDSGSGFEITDDFRLTFTNSANEINLAKLFSVLSLQNEFGKEHDQHDRVKSEQLIEYNNFVDSVVGTVLASLDHVSSEPSRPAVLLTHDVDRLSYREFYFFGRQFSNLLRGRFNSKEFRLLFGKKSDVIHGFEKIMKLERKYSARSVFFFLAEPYKLRRYNSRYSYRDQRLPQVFELIKSAGSEIGLHGSYYSYGDAEYTSEVKRLANVCGSEILASRNHYLRFDPYRTPQGLSKAGIRLDCTHGFSDRAGFRNGSSYPFLLYDHQNDCPLPILEVPLVFMDSPYFDRRLPSEEVIATIDELLKRVKAQKGCISLLFHYEILSASPGWFELYSEVLRKATNHGFEFVTASDLIDRYEFQD